MLRRRLVRSFLIVIGLSPLWAPVFGSLPVLDSAAELLDAWFALQCQRDSARSFAPFATALPVCSRCVGIYLGLALGAIVARPRLTGRQLLTWTLGAATLMLLDVGTELWSLRPASGVLRSFTGGALSFPIAAVLARSSGKLDCAPAKELRHSS
jgi:uncharacterized membrane protein